MTEPTTRHFSLDEANRTLPLVRRIVADIALEYREWRELVRRYEVVAGGATAEEGESEEQIGLREAIDRVARRVTACVAELDQVGCVLKGFEDGLVDFPGWFEGREVFWCWKLGEPEVVHWHEVDSGYAGRQPVPARVEP
jgi:hypothetical protein